MKQTIFTAVMAFTMLLFSGCSVTANFNKDYIVTEVNPYYSKVTSVPVTIVPSYEVIGKKSETVMGGILVMNFETGSINSNVSRMYFEQYFSNVRTEQVSASTKGLVIKSKITDYKYYLYASGNKEIEISLDVVAELNGKQILNKKYQEKFDNQVLLQVFTLKLDERELVYDLFHKALFSLYENSVKKDLLEVL